MCPRSFASVFFGTEPFNLETIAVGLPAAQLIDPLEQLHQQHTQGAENDDAGPTVGITAVVQAPPGTGKTTVVPPALANLVAASAQNSSPREPGRIVVTQPRRVAARSAARRLATLSGTSVGKAVGYTVRGDQKLNPETRVEFVTTGVLLRRLLSDPELPGVVGVVLDEVHERQIESDLTVAMISQLSQLREDLHVVAMSATLDAQRWSDLLGGPVFSAEATRYPLEEIWAPAPQRALDERGVTPGFLNHVAQKATEASQQSDHDVLVFLPGHREIQRVRTQLNTLCPGTQVRALTGQTSPAEQDEILNPHIDTSSGPRIILATNVAESALTVPRVSTVVDAGLDRQQRQDTVRSMSGLVTVGAAKSAMIQRAGRAARTGPGRVIRCIAESEYATRPEHTTPAILTSDLTSAVLDLACWGTPGGEGLNLPDPLPERSYTSACATLNHMGALSGEQPTDLGHKLALIPTEPSLARALLDGAQLIGPLSAAEIVAALSNQTRPPGNDLSALLNQLRHKKAPAATTKEWQRQTTRLLKLATDADSAGTPSNPAQARAETTEPHPAGLITALAYPHRIARLRENSRTEYLLASGTAATLPRESALAAEPWLAIADVGLFNNRPVITSAATLDRTTAELAAGDLLTTQTQATFNPDDAKVTARRTETLGSIPLSSTPIRPTDEQTRDTLTQALSTHGFEVVFSGARSLSSFQELRARLTVLHQVYGAPWPNVSDAGLIEKLDDWLSLNNTISTTDLVSSLRALLPWPQASRLDELVPEHIQVPSGSWHRITYPADEPTRPFLAVKLQECFGMATTPTICDAQLPVTLHLLSPARRPLAVTSDLPSFWTNIYPEVRAENRGRYPKHPWPEDPWSASATARTKRASR